MDGYLYGELNKKVEKVKYKGSETNTSTTSISDSNEIKVDIKKVPHTFTIIEKHGGGQYRNKVFDGSQDVSLTVNSKYMGPMQPFFGPELYEEVAKDEDLHSVIFYMNLEGPESGVSSVESGNAPYGPALGYYDWETNILTVFSQGTLFEYDGVTLHDFYYDRNAINNKFSELNNKIETLVLGAIEGAY